MSAKNIVLIGFMGVGKSMFSNRLGNILNRDVLSTDDLIEQKEGRLVSRIFADSGEAYFRRVEREIVREVSQRKDVIIDCGGGVVLSPENTASLKKTGTLIYLKASPERIYENIKEQGHRPLLSGDDPRARIAELLAQRKPLYEQADYTIETDHKTVEQVCEEIITLLSYE